VALDTYADLFDADLDAVAVALDDARRSSIAVKMQSKTFEEKVKGLNFRLSTGQFGSMQRCSWRDSNPQPLP
jgi:hypothetical protein